MDSASANTYISKRKMDSYIQQRSKKAQSSATISMAPSIQLPKPEEEIKSDAQTVVLAEQQSVALQVEGVDSIDVQDKKNIVSDLLTDNSQGLMAPITAALEAPKQQTMMGASAASGQTMMGLAGASSAPKQTMMGPAGASSAPKQTMMGSIMGKLSGMFQKNSNLPAATTNAANPLPISQIDEDENSAEEVDSDDLEGDLNLSDCEENGEDIRGKIREKRARDRKATGKEKSKYKIEVDANIFEVNFKCLATEAEPATGDPEYCTSCKAIFNNLSKTEVNEANKMIWVCEFCNKKNEVMLEQEEMPKSAQVSYLLQASAQVKNQENKEENKEDNQQKVDETSIIFCLDISGSMQQQIVQKNNNQGIRNRLALTRLDCMKGAVIGQIDSMKKMAENRKVGVIAFDHQVDIIGDANEKTVTIPDQYNNDYDYLLSNGQKEADVRLTLQIKDSCAGLRSTVQNQSVRGRTAIGPAVLTSVAMASKGKPGSTVVICTDGMSNEGIGCSSRCRSDEEFAKVDAVYERIGNFAKQNGVTINIVAIEGDDCNLQSLSKLCELTGGMVDRVNPADLTANFNSFLAKPVIATNVIAKVKLHKGLRFRNENEANISEKETQLTREFGNVTEDVLFTFEYTAKTIKELLDMEDIDFEKIKSFPFQTQISYTNLDGAKMVRVITQSLLISTEKEEVQQKADYSMMNRNVIQNAAKIARGGDERRAQAMTKGYNRQLGKCSNVQAQAAKSELSSQFGQVFDLLNVQSTKKSEAQQMAPPQMASMGNPMMRGMAPPQSQAMRSRAAPMSKSKKSSAMPQQQQMMMGAMQSSNNDMMMGAMQSSNNDMMMGAMQSSNNDMMMDAMDQLDMCQAKSSQMMRPQSNQQSMGMAQKNVRQNDALSSVLYQKASRR